MSPVPPKTRAVKPRRSVDSGFTAPARQQRGGPGNCDFRGSVASVRSSASLSSAGVANRRCDYAAIGRPGKEPSRSSRCSIYSVESAREPLPYQAGGTPCPAKPFRSRQMMFITSSNRRSASSPRMVAASPSSSAVPTRRPSRTKTRSGWSRRQRGKPPASTHRARVETAGRDSLPMAARLHSSRPGRASPRSGRCRPMGARPDN